MDENKQSIILRYIMTGILTLVLFIVTSIKSEVKEIDIKLFEHLTNDEIHVPRGTIVSDAEFEMYKKFSLENYKEIKQEIKELRTDLKGYFNYK